MKRPLSPGSRRTIRTLAALAATASLGLSGCATARWDGQGLPSNTYLVGGGYEIHWTAPSDGTLIIAERTTQKILQTTSVEKDETVDCDFSDADALQVVTGIAPNETRIEAFFIPR